MHMYMDMHESMDVCVCMAMCVCVLCVCSFNDVIYVDVFVALCGAWRCAQLACPSLGSLSDSPLMVGGCGWVRGEVTQRWGLGLGFDVYYLCIHIA